MLAAACRRRVWVLPAGAVAPASTFVPVARNRRMPDSRGPWSVDLAAEHERDTISAQRAGQPALLLGCLLCGPVLEPVPPVPPCSVCSAAVQVPLCRQFFALFSFFDGKFFALFFSWEMIFLKSWK